MQKIIPAAVTAVPQSFVKAKGLQIMHFVLGKLQMNKTYFELCQKSGRLYSSETQMAWLSPVKQKQLPGWKGLRCSALHDHGKRYCYIILEAFLNKTLSSLPHTCRLPIKRADLGRWSATQKSPTLGCVGGVLWHLLTSFAWSSRYNSIHKFGSGLYGCTFFPNSVYHSTWQGSQWNHLNSRLIL